MTPCCTRARRVRGGSVVGVGMHADDAPSTCGQTADVVGLRHREMPTRDARAWSSRCARRAARAPLGFSRDETDVEADALDLRGKKAVVFGVGGRRNAGPCSGDSIDFDGDGCALVGASAARVDALRAFVESGGVFVVNGSGEHAERAFAWFGLPWRFAKERACGEYELNVEAATPCSRTFTFSRRIPRLGDARGGHAASAVFTPSPASTASCTSRRAARVHAWAPRRSVRKKNRRVSRERSRPGGCPLAAARFGLGLVVFAGDNGGGTRRASSREPRALAAGRDASTRGGEAFPNTRRSRLAASLPTPDVRR